MKSIDNSSYGSRIMRQLQENSKSLQLLFLYNEKKIPLRSFA